MSIVPLPAPAFSVSPGPTLPCSLQALKALQDMSSTAPPAPQPSTRKAKTIPVQAFEVHGSGASQGKGWLEVTKVLPAPRSCQQPPHLAYR